MKLSTKPLLLFALILSACAPTPTAPPLSTATLPPSLAPSATPFQPLATTPTASPAPTGITQAEAASAPLSGQYSQYAITAMRARTYGGGQIEILETMTENSAFSRYKIRYPSDGLAIYGFVNVPKGEAAFPVIIAIHGYSDPNNYSITPYTTDITDEFARAGYIVFHPNMRGYGESDDGDSMFRAGLAVDILNLIALIKAPGLQPAPLKNMDAANIGIWSHSMGGEIALRVITVSADIKATMLYAPMTGDVIKNADTLYRLTGLPQFAAEREIPAYIVPAISPMYFYANITSALKLYHGTADTVIPVEYSRETCRQLTALGKEINCAFYEGAKHTFSSLYSDAFRTSYHYFFSSNLKAP